MNSREDERGAHCSVEEWEGGSIRVARVVVEIDETKVLLQHDPHYFRQHSRLRYWRYCPPSIVTIRSLHGKESQPCNFCPSIDPRRPAGGICPLGSRSCPPSRPPIHTIYRVALGGRTTFGNALWSSVLQGAANSHSPPGGTGAPATPRCMPPGLHF
jgi:hypothetical protein